jgi:hypothetical protein
VRGRNPHDEHLLTVGLLEQLLDNGVYKPEFVPMATVRGWFPTRERHLADEIVEDLAANPDAPLEYVTDAERRIWLLNSDETREFLGGLQENPTWFKP